MPPKAKITKVMIVDTAFEIVRKEGADKVAARSSLYCKRRLR